MFLKAGQARQAEITCSHHVTSTAHQAGCAWCTRSTRPARPSALPFRAFSLYHHPSSFKNPASFPIGMRWVFRQKRKICEKFVALKRLCILRGLHTAHTAHCTAKSRDTVTWRLCSTGGCIVPPWPFPCIYHQVDCTQCVVRCGYVASVCLSLSPFPRLPPPQLSDPINPN